MTHKPTPSTPRLPRVRVDGSSSDLEEDVDYGRSTGDGSRAGVVRVKSATPRMTLVEPDGHSDKAASSPDHDAPQQVPNGAGPRFDLGNGSNASLGPMAAPCPAAASASVQQPQAALNSSSPLPSLSQVMNGHFRDSRNAEGPRSGGVSSTPRAGAVPVARRPSNSWNVPEVPMAAVVDPLSQPNAAALGSPPAQNLRSRSQSPVSTTFQHREPQTFRPRNILVPETPMGSDPLGPSPQQTTRKRGRGEASSLLPPDDLFGTNASMNGVPSDAGSKGKQKAESVVPANDGPSGSASRRNRDLTLDSSSSDTDTTSEIPRRRVPTKKRKISMRLGSRSADLGGSAADNGLLRGNPGEAPRQASSRPVPQATRTVMRTLSSDSETGDEEPRRIVRRPRSALVIPSSSELGQISPEVTLPVPARNVIRFPAARRGLDAGSSREPRRDRVLSAETIGRPSRRTPATGERRSVVDLDTPDPIDADGDEDVQIVADSGAALRNRRSRPRRAVEPVLISDSEPESLTDSLRSGNTARSGASVPVVLDDSDDDAVIFASDSDFLPRTRADPPTRMQTLPRRGALSRSFAPAGNLSDDSRTGARNSRTRPPVPMGMNPNSASAERLRQLRQGRMRAPLVENNGVVLVDSDEGELDADLASIRSTVDTRGRDTRRTSTRQSTLDRSTRRPGLSTASSARAQASAGARESDEELALRLQNEEFAAPRFGVGRTTAATFPQAPGDLLPSANRRRGGLSFADLGYTDEDQIAPARRGGRGGPFGARSRGSASSGQPHMPFSLAAATQALSHRISGFLPFRLFNDPNNLASNPANYMPDGALDTASYESLLALSERIGSAVPRTLNRSAVDALPKRKRKEEEIQCPICMDDFEDDGDIVTSLPECDHAFHDACIGTWLEKGNATCPICRKKVTDPGGGSSEPQEISSSSRRSRGQARGGSSRRTGTIQSARGVGPNPLLNYPHLLNYPSHRFLLDSDDDDEDDDLMYVDAAAPAGGSSSRRQGSGSGPARQPAARRTTASSRRPASSSSRRPAASSRARNDGAGIERFLQTFPSANGGASETGAGGRTRDGGSSSSRQRNDSGSGFTLGEPPGGLPPARRPPRDRDPRTGL